MKTQYLGAVVLFLAACSGGQTTGGHGQTDQRELKRAAAEAAGDGSADPASDVCAEHGWYGDGVCDSFCPSTQLDTDCVPDGDDTVCAQFTENRNGECDRSPNDPCLFQDPDCGASVPPYPGDPDGPVACAAISEVSDGVCSRPESDACRTQDPDCLPNGGGTGGNPGTGGGSTGGSPGGGVACPAIYEYPNGVCSRADDDPCRLTDPDCRDSGGVACAEYIEEPNDVCERVPNDPCIFQDPDCNANE